MAQGSDGHSSAIGGSPEEQRLPRLLLVDGHAYAYRSFFAIKRLSSPTGASTNAVFGFIHALERLSAWVKPTHAAVIWDGGLSQERMDLLPGYKAERPLMPEALAQQIPEIMRWLKASGYASIQFDAVEADDLIAALTQRATAQSWAVIIASSDKDFMQLVGSQVTIANPGLKGETLLGEAEVEAKTGVKPAQVVDWLSLVGDAVDNIPGVEGIGPKRAAELLQRFGSVNAIYINLAAVASDRLRVSLESARELVRRNQELVRLRYDVDNGVDLTALRLRSGDAVALANCYREWGFRSLLRKQESATMGQQELF
jgi:DNA polymerase-1